MKIAIRYQSRSGFTKEVAEVIAKSVDTVAASIENPIEEPVDILFIGGGVYKWDIDSSLKKYLENLNPDIIKSVVAFCTARKHDRANTILSIAETKGINVQNETLFIKAGFRYLFGKLFYKKLPEKQIQIINEFVMKIMNNK